MVVTFCFCRELVELLRKMVLNGFLVLCNQGTILQLAIALVIIVIHFAIVLRLQPMLSLSNNRQVDALLV